MMPFPPYFGYPYYRRPLEYSHNSNIKKTYNIKKEPVPKVCSNKQYPNTNNNNNNCNCKNETNNNLLFNTPNIKTDNFNSCEYEQFINIFGFKLYFDDLLILALLFFLYKEEIKDESLYVALILLLLT